MPDTKKTGTKATGDVERFKQALDQQNKVARATGGDAKRTRDAAEAEAAHEGLGALEENSKGRPEQKATTKKSPQAARSQAR